MANEQRSIASSYSSTTNNDQAANLRGLRRLIARRKYLILGVIVGVLAATWIGLNQLTPLYSSTATLLIDPHRTNGSGDREAAPVSDPSDVQNEVEILQSASLLTKVADSLDLYRDPEFNHTLARGQPASKSSDAPRVTTPEKAAVIDNLVKSISVQVRGRSRVIGVTVTSENPAKATNIATRMVDLYLQDQRDTKITVARNARRALGDQVEALAKRSAESQAAVLTFSGAHPLAEDRDINATTQQLNEIVSQLTTAQSQRVERDARLRQVRALIASHGRVDAIGDVLGSSLIQSLNLQEADLRRREAELVSRYGDRHPKLVEVRAQVADLKRKINDEIARIVGNLNNEVEVVSAREAGLTSTRDGLLKRVAEAGHDAVQLANLQHEADANRTLYETQSTHLKEMEGQEHMLEADARVLSSATLPSDPVFPRQGRVLAVAFAFSLLLAAGVVYMIEGMDDGLRSPEQVEHEVGLPCMAVLPTVSTLLRKRRPEDVVLEPGQSPYLDLLQGLQVNIGLIGAGERTPIVLVTSSVKGEGKTALAVSLGRLASLRGTPGSVLVIDCDLRRAEPYDALGLRPRHSLHDYLLGKAERDQIVTVDERSGLHVIVAGGPAINVPNLIGSPRMRQLLADIEKSYDMILLDAPAVVGHVDTRLLLQLSTQTLFLIEWGKTSREVVIDSLRPFAEGDSPLSLVLSKVNLRKMARYSPVGLAQKEAIDF